MIGSFITRSLALILGYAYPAYECFKTVELNKPDIEQLLFWCQYWILVAALTVFERVGDNFISWIPMYSEAKLAFFVYLWYPKTKGTTYVYETFFRPYVAKHENEIDRNLLELRTRAGDIMVLYFQKVASYGQTRIFEILQYVASQSPSQSSRTRPVQRQPQPPIRRTSSTTAAREPTEQLKQAKSIPSSPTKSQPQEPLKAGVTPAEAVAAQLPSSSGLPGQPNTETTTLQPTAGDEEASQAGVANATDKENPKEEANPPAQEKPIEEAIRVTRARLRKRAATAAGPSAR
ncbi:HVA22-like protein [Musa troglodytarum]|uniref:HVA22-like protein n=1 Tax=Musa troglodytarum TaxID=320322 RepID=A0A9E7HEM1_9LILI|nr:HVA22-like protein [Musa troglodytarum]URE28467.1 HVA22-like protein [Musa troglodytarum]